MLELPRAVPQLTNFLNPFSHMIQGVIQCATIACVQGMLGATLEYSSGNLYMMRSGTPPTPA